jgi:hypothetical protein
MADTVQWFVAKVRRTGAHREEQRPVSRHLKTKEEAEAERDRIRALPENADLDPEWTIEVRLEASPPLNRKLGNSRRR